MLSDLESSSRRCHSTRPKAGSSKPLGRWFGRMCSTSAFRRKRKRESGAGPRRGPGRSGWRAPGPSRSTGGDGAGGAAVPFRLAGHPLDGVRRLGQAAERQHAFAGRDDRAEARILHDRGHSQGQVAARAAGEPAAPAGHEGVLGDAPLRERVRQVVAVDPGILRDAVGIREGATLARRAGRRARARSSPARGAGRSARGAR